jgi:hypothetical protein
MQRNKLTVAITSALLALGVHTELSAQESLSEQLAKAVQEGSVKLDLRYRVENVDDDAFDKDATASTLRSRLTLKTGSVAGFTGLVEVDNVSYIGNDNFNSTENGVTDRPVVPDPKGTEVNQAWLQYKTGELAGTYGRQRIVHGSQRFVGGVAWRQNEQTYDGFRAHWGEKSALSVDYAYVYNVNRIFGPDDRAAQPANWGGENHLARVNWKIADGHSLSGFAYLLDIDERGGYAPNKSVNNSTDTFGLEYTGSFGPVSAKAAYAQQSDGGDSYLDYDADYYMVEAAAKFAGVKATAGYEVLGSDNNVGFKTPLATLHKFQGWADKFLVTPGDGIEDMYLSAAGKLGPVKMAVIYHDFSAEDSSEDFGTEWNLIGTWPINKQFTTQLKYANFSSDSDRYTDVQKVWFTLQMKL